MKKEDKEKFVELFNKFVLIYHKIPIYSYISIDENCFSYFHNSLTYNTEFRIKAHIQEWLKRLEFINYTLIDEEKMFLFPYLYGEEK